MALNKQKVLAGDLAALQQLLLVNYIQADHMASNDVGDLDGKQGLAVALAVKAGDIALDFQTDSQAFIGEVARNIPQINAMTLAYCQFCFEILQPYLAYNQLDEALKAGQSQLQRRVFLQSLAEPLFWIKPHALKNASDFLYLVMLGWQSGHGQHSDNLQALYQKTVNALVQVDLRQASAFAEIEKQARSEFYQTQQFLDKFLQRMKTAETAKIKNQCSQLEALLFINRLTHGKRLPKNLAHFLQNKLLADSHIFLVKHGIDSKIWQQIQQLLTQLVEMYQEGASLSNRHKQLPNLLQTFIEQYLHRDEGTDDILNQIAFDISLLSVGKTPDNCIVAGPLSLPDHLQNVERHTSEQLIKNCQQFKEGQWFLWQNKETQQLLRCQLCVKLDAYNQVLFASFVGQRVLAASIDDFAYFLSAKHLTPLSMYGGLTRCLHNKLDKLLESFEQREQEKHSHVQNIKAKQLQALELQAKKLAAEKAKHEAEIIAKRKAAEQQELLKQQQRDDLKRHARLTLDSLALGSWVDFVEEDGSLTRAKLAVKLNASGRFIFVDDGGITIAEKQRDDLIDLLLNGKLKLLESDKKFTERLSKIVSDLRASQ